MMDQILLAPTPTEKIFLSNINVKQSMLTADQLTLSQRVILLNKVYQFESP